MNGYASWVEDAYDDAVTSDPYIHKSAVSMSMIGKCRRQAAYALRDGWPATPGLGSPQAYLGSAIHSVLLPDLAERLGGVIETPVELDIEGITLTGTADLLAAGEVVDLKTTSQYYYDVVTTRVPLGNKLQVTGYALGTGAAGCTLLYVNRSDGARYGESWSVEDHTEDLVNWVRGIQHDPAEVPRDERGPGLSMVCDSCPFATQCWGEPVLPALPQSVVITEHGIELALDEYDRARAAEKDAKADKEFWRAALEACPPGPYGGWQLSWSNPRATEKTDYAAMEAQFLEMGLPVPTKTVQGNPSIGVKKRPAGKIPTTPEQ